MKTFDELTPEQQEEAVEKEAIRLLSALADGSTRRVNKRLQAVVDEAWTEMERLSTPWFFGEAVWEEIGTDLKNLVLPTVEGQLFAEIDSPEVVYGIADR